MADTAPEASSPAALEKAPPQRAPVHYGPWARWLLGRMFAPVQFPKEAVEPLKALASRTTPVYVLRSSSLIALLYFNWSFWKHGLPLARAATGLGSRVFAPFARWYLGGEQVKATERGALAQI